MLPTLFIIPRNMGQNIPMPITAIDADVNVGISAMRYGVYTMGGIGLSTLAIGVKSLLSRFTHPTIMPSIFPDMSAIENPVTSIIRE